MNDKLDLLYQQTYDLHQLIRDRMLAREPIDFPVQLSATMPWSLDYRNRKHLFIWSPVALTLSIEDYGSYNLVANTWRVLDFQPGTKIYATNITTPIYGYIKATDEIIIDEDIATSIAAPVTIGSPTGSPGDGLNNPTTTILVNDFLQGWNGSTWDRLKELSGGILRIGLSSNNAVFATGAGNTVIKASPGDLVTIIINAAGTTAFQIFDNPTTNSGNVLYTSTATTSVGQVITIYGYAKTGITLANTASGPAGIVYFN